MATTREQLFGPASGTHFWCLHCERTYLKNMHRVDAFGLEVCPYKDCTGDAVLDAWEWEKVRDGRKARYPEVPLYGTTYPLHD